MSKVMCYCVLLLAVHTENIAGVLRGLREVNAPTYLEAKHGT